MGTIAAPDRPRPIFQRRLKLPGTRAATSGGTRDPLVMHDRGRIDLEAAEIGACDHGELRVGERHPRRVECDDVLRLAVEGHPLLLVAGLARPYEQAVHLGVAVERHVAAAPTQAGVAVEE